MKKIVLIVFSLVMLFTTGHAQQQIPTIPLDPAVKTGVLSNGLTYFIRHNEWPEKRVDFYIAQKVGSMQEEETSVVWLISSSTCVSMVRPISLVMP